MPPEPGQAAHVDLSMAPALRVALAEQVDDFADIVGSNPRAGQVEQAKRQGAELGELRKFAASLRAVGPSADVGSGAHDG